MYDAIVVGGGVVGMSAAYHLVRGGARTLLLERGDRGRATDAGAGILPATSAIDDPDPLERLKARAAQYYPELIERLRADDAGDTGHAVTGSLTVAVVRRRGGAVRAHPGGPAARERSRRLCPAVVRAGAGAVPAARRGAAARCTPQRMPGSTAACSRGALRRAAEARGLVLRTDERRAPAGPRRQRPGRRGRRRGDPGRTGGPRRGRLVGSLRRAARRPDPGRAPARPDHPPPPARGRDRRMADRARVPSPLHRALAGRPRGGRSHARDRLRLSAAGHRARRDGGARRGAAGRAGAEGCHARGDPGRPAPGEPGRPADPGPGAGRKERPPCDRSRAERPVARALQRQG